MKKPSFALPFAVSTAITSVLSFTPTKHEQLQSRPRRQLDEVLYRRNIFNKAELEIIQNDAAYYLGRLQPETHSSVAHGRRGTVLPRDAPLVQVFRQGSLLEWIIRATGNPSFQLRDDVVPVEIRSYDKRGAGMAWHSDDVLFAPYPQLEVVWTLENTSDCQTLYFKATTSGSRQGNTTESIQTEVNSVLLVPAGGPEHCVTSLQRGRRIIIKAVFTPKDCTFVQEVRVAQFNKDKSKSSPRKGKRR